jgi:hypothetical protein
VGLQPAYLAGRGLLITRFKRLLRGAPSIPANARITGLRGVGKTVLLQKFREEAESMEWATITHEVQPKHAEDTAFFTLVQQLTTDLEKRMSAAARMREFTADALDAIRKVIRVKFEGFEWSIAGDLDAGARSTAEMLLNAAKAAVSARREGLVVLLDEAQILADQPGADGSHALSSLLAAVSELQKQEIPIALCMCGLPTLTVNLLAARTYSERMFVGFKVDSLGEFEATEALVKPLEAGAITADADLVKQVIADVDGYPYFIQLWGAELWDATADAGLDRISIATLDAIRERIQERLDLDFYAPRVDSLTPAEQDLLLETVGCSYPPIVVAELNKHSIKTNENINVLLGRLVKSNALYRQRMGQYLYTAPRFREYLQRRAAEEDGTLV